MDYNTSRGKLILSEYGRNIQMMVEYTMKIEDYNERNRAARAIIAVMGNMNPHLRDINDFKHKLWDHLALMSDFELEIDYPYPLPTVEKMAEKPRNIPYKNGDMRYRHYGRVVEMMLRRIVAVEDQDNKENLVQAIAGHMKRLYFNWHNENISDESIMTAVQELSRHELKLSPSFHLEENRESRESNSLQIQRKKPKTNNRK